MVTDSDPGAIRPRPEFLGLGLLERTYPTIAENLALDEALLLAAEEHGAGPVLRLWEPATTAVVLGASGKVAEDVHGDACRADGVAVARRSSGGGTVVVGPGTLNVALILPIAAHPALGAVDTAQAFVLGRIAEALRDGGVPVEVLGSGDLTLGGRKFSGSAQRRLRRHVLIHATILHDFPLASISRYLALPRRQPSYRAARSHESFLTNLPLAREELARAVRAAWLPEG